MEHDICRERLEAIRNHPLYQSSLRRLNDLERGRIFCRHGMEHLLDTARIAYIKSLERALPLSRDLIYAAALLHDIGKWEQYENGTPHELQAPGLQKRSFPDFPLILDFLRRKPKRS